MANLNDTQSEIILNLLERYETIDSEHPLDSYPESLLSNK